MAKTPTLIIVFCLSLILRYADSTTCPGQVPECGECAAGFFQNPDWVEPAEACTEQTPGVPYSDRSYVPPAESGSGMITASVRIVPSGVLTMLARWYGKNGHSIASDKTVIYILTNFRDPPASAVHSWTDVTVNVGSDGNEFYLDIVDWNLDKFAPVN